MKIIYITLSLACFSVAGLGQSTASNDTENDTQPFKLEITANSDRNHSSEWDFVNNGETTLKAGSMIVIAIRKTNISNREINKWSLLGQMIEIRDSCGEIVKPRPIEERQGRSGSVEGMLRGTKDMLLQPHESKIHSGRISDGYDLSQPGTYTVQVSEHVTNDPNSDVVKSNIVTVTLLAVSEDDASRN